MSVFTAALSNGVGSLSFSNVLNHVKLSFVDARCDVDPTDFLVIKKKNKNTGPVTLATSDTSCDASFTTFSFFFFPHVQLSHKAEGI